MLVNAPIEFGFVDSLKKPGGNMTGIIYRIQESKRFEWLITLAPTAKHVYVPYNPEDKGSVTTLAVISETAKTLGL
ncbi:MAG: hypothetical protein JXA33_02640 [Anaerolineae bacterium]|nr:hypothetical protein [Anaerolineae bacterium]